MKDGVPLQDPLGDIDPAGVDVVGNATYPAAYMFNNGSALFFRMRLDVSPSGPGGLDQNSWGVEFDTDGNFDKYEWLLQVNGGTETVDLCYNSASGNTIGSPGDNCDDTFQMSLSPALGTYATFSVAPSTFSGDADYFLDWYVPYYDFLNITGLSNYSAVTLFFGSSTSTQALTKDLVNGSTLSGMSSDIVTPKGTTTTNGTIRIVNSSYLGNVTSINLSDTIYVWLNDFDRNTDNTSIDTVDVIVLTETGDNETLTLSETFVSSGVFTGSILTNFSDANYLTNGKLEVRQGVIFNVAYNDTLSDGNYTNLIDSASVKPLININYSSPVEYGSSSNLTINISGYHNSSYIVYKNGTNIANGSYLDGVSFNVSVNTSVRTIWNYTVWANDSFDYNTNSTTVWVTIIDTTPPASITNLHNNSYAESYINWIWTNPPDSDFEKVMVYLDGIFKENITGPTNYYNVTGLTYDTNYTISTHTVDFTGNINSTWVNYTTRTSGSDLAASTITFVYGPEEATEVTETGEVKENINLTINATIINKGVSAAGSYYVLFYDGGSEFYNVSMGALASGASVNATGYWTTLPGTHNITVKADSARNTNDTNWSNNNASKLINVSAWQKYYGNVTGQISLGDSSGNS